MGDLEYVDEIICRESPLLVSIHLRRATACVKIVVREFFTDCHVCSDHVGLSQRPRQQFVRSIGFVSQHRDSPDGCALVVLVPPVVWGQKGYESVCAGFVPRENYDSCAL